MLIAAPRHQICQALNHNTASKSKAHITHNRTNDENIKKKVVKFGLTNLDHKTSKEMSGKAQAIPNEN